MSECEKCRADKTVCQYCIYKNKNNNEKMQDSDNIIYYNNIKDDNKSKKICPILQKGVYGISCNIKKRQQNFNM